MFAQAGRRPFWARPVLIDHIGMADSHYYYHWLADSHYILFIIIIRITIVSSDRSSLHYGALVQTWVGEPD